MTEQVVPSAEGFLCLLCNRFFKLKSSVSRHMADNHVRSNISYSCPICKKLYKNKSSFSVHIYTMHPELKGADYERNRGNWLEIVLAKIDDSSLGPFGVSCTSFLCTISSHLIGSTVGSRCTEGEDAPFQPE